MFAGWQTAALKAHRKPLLWPCPGVPVREVALALGWVPVGEVALALGCLLDKVFGGFGRFWRAPGGFGGFWRVWRVLEGV